MDLDDIKAQLDRIFAAGNRTSTREQAPGLREALVDFKVGISQIRDALTRAERDLEIAQGEAANYARRGNQAREIGDEETVRVAEEFTARANERVELLDRKVAVLRDELAMAEREYGVTKARFQSASRGLPLDASTPDTPGVSGPDQALLDQRAREAAVEAQLAHLKKKLGDTK